MTTFTTVKDIISACGGVVVLGEAVERPRAPEKWAQNGIPERHWSVVMELSGATVEQIYAANRRARAPASPEASQGKGSDNSPTRSGFKGAQDAA